MDELTITFSGICTTLHDIVPGVPMRAVLPYASNVYFGFVFVPQPNNQPPRKSIYYLMPHIATVHDQVVGGRQELLAGYSMTVANAIGDPLTWSGGAFRLREFVSDLRLDDAVVFGGYAAAYFDLSRGCAWSEGSGDEMRLTRVRVQTNGTPCVRMVPMPDTRGLKTIEWYVDSHELFVSNSDFDPALADGKYDFLMNYLVAAGGLPSNLSQPVPGMTFDPPELTLETFGRKLKALGIMLETMGSVLGYRNSGGTICVDPPSRKGGIASLRAIREGLDETSLYVQAPQNLSVSCSPGSLP